MASPEIEDLTTVPLPAPAPDVETVPKAEPEVVEPERPPAKDGGRWWRGLTGSLAAGLAVLAVGVLVVAGICLITGAPGPGLLLAVGHPVAAVLALAVQRVADRRNGPIALVAGLGVVAITAAALTFFWLT